MKEIAHQEFVDSYKKGELDVFINKVSVGRFVLSPLANKHNKPAHIFWSLISILLVFVAPVVLLFIRNFVYSVGALVLGLMAWSATKKSACQFVLQNMLEDEKFCKFVLLNKGAVIKNKQEKEVSIKEIRKS